MPSPGWIRVTIGLFAAGMILAALITGKAIEEEGLRWIAGISGLVTLALLAFDRWLWRWPLVREITERTGSRVLRGTWRGQLDYIADGDGNPGSTQIYMSVLQTYSTIEVRCFFPSTGSTSESLSADLIDEAYCHRLRYHYRVQAPAPALESNRPTQGACDLIVVGRPVEEISGDYYAERGGKGTIAFDGYSPTIAGSPPHAMRLTYRELPR